jgi:uncharacterized protein YbjT (DUF2867 family)
MKTAIIAGASGLVGSALLPMLLERGDYEKVISLGRKTLAITHPKLQQLQVDFNDLESLALKADDVFCCLGTTIKVAKTRERFYEVDHDYPLNLAKAAKNQGAQGFYLISAVSADEHSRIFYSRVKGKLENELKTMDFRRLVILRPSMLLGPRKEFRMAEWISKQIMSLFSWLIPARYKAVKDTQVARTLMEHCIQGAAGIHILENEVILRTKG